MSAPELIVLLDVTSTIPTLIIDGISSHSSLLDSYVVLHAGFVSSLHKILGIEFGSVLFSFLRHLLIHDSPGAYFTQSVVATYDKYRKELREEIPPGDDPRGKECSNTIVLLSELYNFQVISSVLMFDIIRAILDEEITELTVELLLKVIQSIYVYISFLKLVSDDDSRFWTTTTSRRSIFAQRHRADCSEQARYPGKCPQVCPSFFCYESMFCLPSVSSRARFMVETLINLKNNKLRKGITNTQGGDAVERMKKFLAGLSKKRHGASSLATSCSWLIRSLSFG
jgi:nucleolar MIF4G domain-containing protein 1